MGLSQGVVMSRAEEVLKRVTEGGRRGGESTSAQKRKTAQENIAKARATREMYRKFPILREKRGLNA